LCWLVEAEGEQQMKLVRVLVATSSRQMMLPGQQEQVLKQVPMY
jgi:hypothetical protein